MKKYLYPHEYVKYMMSRLDIKFHYTHYEAWLKRDGKWLFVVSGDDKKETEEAARDILKTLVDYGTVYEVVSI